MHNRSTDVARGVPDIAVVMSTYNGCEFVSDQIESVLAQDVSSLALYVRDDGSTDGTLQILEEYERRGQLTLLRGKNVGVVASFIEAISLVPPEVPYIALCDQDDVWHPDKLSRALEVLSSHDGEKPLYYCAEYMFCDAEMRPQSRSHLARGTLDLAKMLYENATSGNTCVINRALAERVARAGAQGVYCHDWWLALVASALGEVVHDDFSCLEYRRTGSNASPTGSGGLAILRYRIKTFFDKGELRTVTDQLVRLDEAFGEEMPAERRRLLSRFLLGSRLRKAFAPVRLRQRLTDELALRLLFLLGLL